MKKVFIGLLIAAAGTGAYFYFQQGKKTERASTANHALLIGKWEADTLQAGKDKAFSRNSYQFADSNTLILTGHDSLAKKDTFRYQWDKADVISWKHAQDTSAVTFTVHTLNKDSVALIASDSSRILLLRAR